MPNNVSKPKRNWKDILIYIIFAAAILTAGILITPGVPDELLLEFVWAVLIIYFEFRRKAKNQINDEETHIHKLK